MKPTRTQTKRLREAICLRAGGRCESCGVWVGANGEEGQLDHQFGRAKAPQNLATCWLICADCHQAKTLSMPNAAHWLRRFITHAEAFGYAIEAEMAATKISTLVARGRAA